jgi:hypothetical protein
VVAADFHMERTPAQEICVRNKETAISLALEYCIMVLPFRSSSVKYLGMIWRDSFQDAFCSKSAMECRREDAPIALSHGRGGLYSLYKPQVAISGSPRLAEPPEVLGLIGYGLLFEWW